MVENLSNIGQMLVSTTLETQVVPAKSDAPKTKKFSVSNEDSFQNNKASEFAQIETNTDRGNKRAQTAVTENEINTNQNKVQKDNTNTPEKIQRDTKTKQADTNPDANRENDIVEALPIDKHKAGIGNIVNDIVKISIEAKKEQIKQTVAAHVSEKSNSVTGHGVKSAEIKSLHLEEKGQLGIKTILSEKSNGQNGLKVLTAENMGKKAEDLISQKQESAQNIEQENNTKAQQNSLETLNDKIKKIGTDVINEKKSEVEPVFTKEHKNNSDLITPKENFIKNQLNTAKQIYNNITSNTDAPVNIDKKLNKGKFSFLGEESEVAKIKKELFNEGIAGSGDTIKQKIVTADFQLSQEKVKNKSNQIFNNKSNVIEQVITNADSASSGKTSGVMEGKNLTNNIRENMSGNISSNISRQITESIHSSMIRNGGEKQITVRLNPPELGSVIIKFNEQDTQLSGILEVSKSQTKIEIEQALPQIIRNLAENGIQLKRVEVISTESDHAENDLLKEQLMSDNNSGQYDSSNQQEETGNYSLGGFRQWLTNAIEYEGSYGFESEYAGSGSINMLL